MVKKQPESKIPRWERGVMFIADLNPAIYNPRTISDENRDRLRKSLECFGVVQDIIVNTYPGREGVIVGGHQRTRELQAIGEREVEVTLVYLPLDKEQALNVALNNPNLAGEWDRDKLKDVLEELDHGGFDLTLTGFTDDELEGFLTSAPPPGAGLTDPDEIPDGAQVETRCKPGDLWVLGGDPYIKCEGCGHEFDV